MDYTEHLSKDRRMAQVLRSLDALELQPRKNVCLRLCASIMSQQLSTKVAKVLYLRFLGLFEGKEPKPAQITELSVEQLRGIGLSNAKAQYVLNVAQFFIDNKIDEKKLRKMDDEAVIELLTQIKGVGRWTVEMLLMFTLGREDVFAVDDYGIQMAMKKLYKLDDSNKKEFKQKMHQIASKWAPYRTYACRHLWDWKDGE
ncbi:MAG: DNA-3-methyladenine glycosylase 2 family protein [Chitinophagaceae bacterium]|nr:MAG: DNA-3-methyladenine glycosylase 2 family protein [Chitinophagaceae bacterium]